MDILTHALLPYAAALVALGLHKRAWAEDRARLGLAVAVGLGGAAPDFDSLLSWTTRLWDAPYFLQHRGVSHTLLGAPLFALAVVGGALLLARLWPRRFWLMRWRAAFFWAAMLGGWSHLVLDAVTFTGVPLLWPFAWGRIGINHFHWLVWWLFPLSGLVLLLHARRWLAPRRVAQAGALVLVALVVLAGVRLATKPASEEGERVFPRPSELEWTVVREVGPNAYEARLVRAGATTDSMRFTGNVPAAARDAYERALDHPSTKGWRMESYGPIVVDAAPVAGGWNVTFIDVAARFEALHDPSWTPARPFTEWGIVSLEVVGAQITVTRKGW